MKFRLDLFLLSINIHLLLYTFSSGPVKLSSGSDVGLGYIMLYDDINDSWVYACADDWNSENNDVVCKQLGYKAGAGKLYLQSLCYSLVKICN